MRLSELVTKLQADLEANGDTENVGFCLVIGKGPKHRLDAFGNIEILRDTGEFVNGMTYLVAEYAPGDSVKSLHDIWKWLPLEDTPEYAPTAVGEKGKLSFDEIKEMLLGRTVRSFNYTKYPSVHFDVDIVVRHPCDFIEYRFNEEYSAPNAVYDGIRLTMPDAQGFMYTFEFEGASQSKPNA